MTRSHSAILLLAGSDASRPHLAQLRTILEEAHMHVLVAIENASSTETKKWLAQVCVEHHPSLVIHSLDHQYASAGEQLGGFSDLSLEVPLIVAAHNFDAVQIQRMLELGVTDFITPPFNAASILPRIWRLLRFNAEGTSAHATLQERMAMQRLGLIGQSLVFLDEIKKLKLLARCDITVIIGGETGTGKELVARAIHYLSPRSDCPFVPVDCGAIPPELTESELFGHERGAFTGAIAKNPGLVTAADHGTLFLDEVDALNLSVQAKLLRFLQEREYRALGSSEVKKADVRVISATNRDLLQRVRSNDFRKDLYYRLNVVQLRLPSLRQRREDIVPLARHFAAKYISRFNQPHREFSAESIQKLIAYDWPGNIRELENVVSAGVALCDGPLIRASDLTIGDEQTQLPRSFREAKAQIIAEFEREYITRLLDSFDGNVSEAARAARKNRRAFWELIRKHQIDVRGLSSDDPVKRKVNARARGFATA